MTYHGRSLKDAACNEESTTVSDAGLRGSQQHSVADDRYHTARDDERTSHFDPVRVCCSGKDNEEGCHIRWHCEKLSCDT